ncbi:unnamed protein product [Cladocopium goreaui]|uniref:Uncharacterized protein n=1 Tax=Cladocopium goreaui TaxID=2562237 RepID=A0A9P1DP29_9DINO|nr:unnamed protein product [Cladocopium goreaui]CAI3997641.1 unnamed protein product [Cladocopium goreaui]CAI4013884.1 unnamed protein product [Cladocopium goreaui]
MSGGNKARDARRAKARAVRKRGQEKAIQSMIRGGLSIRSFKEKKISWRVREAHAEQLRVAKASLPAAQREARGAADPYSCHKYMCSRIAGLHICFDTLE